MWSCCSIKGPATCSPSVRTQLIAVLLNSSERLILGCRLSLVQRTSVIHMIGVQMALLTVLVLTVAAGKPYFL